QWQISTDSGATFNDIPGETSPTYTFTAALTDSGHQYRAVFTNSCSPSATTTAATLTVDDTLTISTQPTDQTVCTPNSATFTAAASGPATVQWQVSNGGPFTDIPGETSTTLTFTPVLADSGKQYRAVFTNACGSATTNTATLTVHAPPAVTTQPTNQTVCNGATATFTAAASGTPAPTVQWQVSSGGPFSDIPGATSTTLTFTATSADNGKQYRAVFTNSCSTATTNAATLTVPTVAISPAAGALTAAIYHAGYSQTFTASGGTAPYTYAISPATPPAGLSFNTSTGVLSGSAPTLPDNTGNFSFSISATDSNGCQVTQNYTLQVKPGATNDTYSNVVGNTQAWVSGGTTTQPATPAYTLTGSVLANDVAPAGATASAGGTTTNGGSVAVASDGTFLYTPPVGTITNDTFTYTITSNGATNTAVVTIQFNNRVWWVKNNAAAGDGRSNTPFNTLSSAGSSSAANDIIFVYAGDGTTNNQNSGITLKNNQLLTGEALALVVNGQTLVAAGATPLIGNSGGAVITVANGDFIQGLNITAVNTAGISVGAGVTGTTSIGTVSVFIAGGSSNLAWTNGGITISAAGSAGAGVNATGGSGTITLTNVPINVNAGGTSATGAIAIAIASKSGGGLTLTGGSTVTAGTAGSRQIVSPIQITNSAGTYSFANKLDLWTTGGTATGFLASNSGTLTTTDTTSTIDTAGSPAINVQNTTIGAGNLNFRSVSANGGANGIFLDTTGASGGLHVTGTVASTSRDSSGGTIQNMTGSDGSTSGHGVYMNSTSNVSLNHMNVHDVQGDGIHGTSVSGFTLTYTIVTSTLGGWNGTTTAQLGSFHGEGDVQFVGLTGSALVDNNAFDRAFYNTFGVFNSGGSLNRLVMTNNSFGLNDTVQGNNGVALQPQGGTFNTTFNNNTITAAGSNTFVLDMHLVASCDLIMHNNTISNNHPNIVTGGGGVSLQSGGVGDQVAFTFDVDTNTFRDSHGAGFFIGTGQLHNGQNFSGNFNNNTIGVQGVANSGSTTGNDLFMQNRGSTTNINITNNQLYQYNPNATGALQLEVGDDGAHVASATFVVTGNTISNPGTVNPNMNGMQLNSGPSTNDASKTCLTIFGNSVTGSGKGTGTDIRLRQRMFTDVALLGNGSNYGGAVNDTAAVNAFVASQQTPNTPTVSSLVTNSPPHGFKGVCPP
ncbi:MAG: hypothetical protein DMF57_02140, partial [Acidobacteria bacterium]